MRFSANNKYLSFLKHFKCSTAQKYSTLIKDYIRIETITSNLMKVSNHYLRNLYMSLKEREKGYIRDNYLLMLIKGNITSQLIY